MNSQTDQELLRDYAERQSEAAFAELVRRHVDFAYSAALRMVRDTHLAEDVTQSVFVALAQNARQLTDRPVLSGWLHRAAQNLAANAVRSDVRRRAREQEAAAMNELFCAEPDAVWERIASHLDAALGELNEADRDALLLRYFERKSAQEMAQVLGVSDEAAQKRVNRAVERLREFFAKRGVTVGASGLVVVISANAVQAAPVGLGAAIAAAAKLTKATVLTMNWLNGKAVAGIVSAAIIAGSGTYFALQQKQAHADAGTRTADSKDSTTEPIVAFFKRTISSTPDIEYFVASGQNLRPPDMPVKQAEALERAYKAQGLDPNRPSPLVFYDGAKSGENYFLGTFLSTNLPGNGKSDLYSKFVSGRFGSNSYRVEAKFLRMTSEGDNGSGRNSIAILTAAEFSFVSQIFHMGVGSLVDENAVWNGNEFTARRKSNALIYGELTISNNLPFSLRVRETEAAPGYMVRYVYPDPPQSRGGFPAKMIKLNLFKDGWQPSMEMTLLECRLAQTKLNEDFFSPAKFVTTNVTSTNIYSNGASYALLPDGELRENYEPPAR